MVRAFFLVSMLACGLAVVPAAQAQLPGGLQVRPAEAPVPVRIVALYGRRTLRVGEAENFRVRVAPGAAWPIRYTWDLGDGTRAEGNNIVHRYQRAGTFTVTVEARNRNGTDSFTVLVTVSAPPAPLAPERPTPAADRSTGVSEPARPARRPDAGAPRRPSGRTALWSSESVVWSRGGYTWVVTTSFERRAAEVLSHRYRAAGYRAGVFVDDAGPGSTVYRVVVGQFTSPDEALALRRSIIQEQPGNIWLLELPTPTAD